MEDRYLFRAKRIDNGKWVQGAVLFHDNAATIFNQHPSDGSLQGFEVDIKTVCQCTGLEDRNGKLIWENDIVKRKFRLYSGETKYAEKENCGVVKYDKEYARFGYQCSVFAMVVESRKHDTFEVIGNVFDNPELLEV